MRKTIGVAPLTTVLAAATALAVCAPMAAAEVSVPEEWKSLDPGGLVALVKGMTPEKDPGGSQRSLLVAYLNEKYLQTAEATRMAPCWLWLEVGMRAKEQLGPAGCSDWIAELREAHATAEGLVALKAEDIPFLVWALQGLGDKDTRSLIVAWAGASTKWQSMKAEHLPWFAQNLEAAGDETKGMRTQLAAHVMGKYLASAEATRSMPCWAWSEMARTLSGFVGAASRESWIQELKNAYVEPPPPLAALKPDEQLALARTFRYLGSDGTQDALMAYMSGTPAWKSMKPGDLVWLAQNLTAAGEKAGALRAQLAQHVTGTYVGTAEATRTVSCEEWSEFARTLSGSLDDQTRQAWAEKLTGAYAGGDVLAALKPDDQIRVARTFRYLGAGDTAGVLIAYMSAGPAWRSLGPDDLAWLAQNLDAAGDEAKALRESLAEHVVQTYLVTAESAKRAGPWAWSELARTLRKHVTYASRQAWIERLRAAYGSPEGLAPLGPDEVLCLGAALDHLGSRPAYDVLILYMDTAPWRSFKPDALARLADKLNGLGALAGKQRLAVAQYAMATFAATPEAVRAVPLETWIPLTRTGDLLPEDARRTWADAIRGALVANDEALLAMKAPEVHRLTEALAPLDWDEAVALAHAWMTRSDHVAGASMQDLWKVAAKAVCHKELRKEERDAIPTIFEDALAKMPDQATTYDYYLWLMCQWNAVDNEGKVQEWAMKAYQTFLGSEDARAAVPMGVLENLAMWFRNSRMTGQGKAYPAFTAALTSRARDGTFKAAHPAQLAAMLGTPESRLALRSELTDAAGAPRLDVARVLATAHQQAGDLATWRDWVDQQLAESEGDADRKAGWLLVRACTESALSSPAAPLRGKKWLDEALAVAASTANRLLALEELVRGYVHIAKYNEAMGLIGTQEGRLAGAEAGNRLEALRHEVVQAQADAAQQVREARARAVGGYRDELLRRLQAARTRGDADDVARYERLLQRSD